VISAIKSKEKICIFADYDVDGATSSALLKNFFAELGIIVDIYVPDRIEEGYGPSIIAMQKLKDRNTELVITVDCGAMAHDPLQFAKTIGLDVIVIDHHIGAEILPDAVAVVNPNRLDEKSEYGYLAAVGVSYLFAVGLFIQLRKINYFSECAISEPNLINYLDLVALGTVCDVMPIRNLNRAFVAQGLKIMQQRRNIGINSLLDQAGIKEPPNSYHLGFVIGPRVNAGGRVGAASSGANLLSTKCHSEAEKIALRLEEYNNQRKLIEDDLLQEAHQQALQQVNNPLIYIIGNNWHPGVIGIIASRIKDKFLKPVAVIAVNNGLGKASCRSIQGIDFGSKLMIAKDKGLLLAGGGHAMAAGFTVLEEHILELQQFLNSLFLPDVSSLPEVNLYYYDMDLTSDSITPVLLEEIMKLEPYGNYNPEPIFRISELYVLKASIVGAKHIKCLLAPSRNSYASKAVNAIIFNALGTTVENILLSSYTHSISVIGSLKSSYWNGKTSLQLYIHDVITTNTK
jgi:single-stranded-DNA-specific exonuclease